PDVGLVGDRATTLERDPDRAAGRPGDDVPGVARAARRALVVAAALGEGRRVVEELRDLGRSQAGGLRLLRDHLAEGRGGRDGAPDEIAIEGVLPGRVEQRPVLDALVDLPGVAERELVVAPGLRR